MSFAGATATAADVAIGAGMAVGPGLPAYPAGVYYYPYGAFPGPYWDCARFGSCLGAAGSTARTYRERREEVRRQREEIATPKGPATPDLWDSDGSPWGYTRRLPPPTPESEIQPAYRDAGQVRPEYRDAGQKP